MEKRGVVILAVKNEVYGKMAYNLAKSIKLPNENIKVQIICDEVVREFLGDKINEFDEITFLSDAYWQSFHPGRIKSNIYSLACFDKNLFIDADSIMVPTADIEKLFDELDGRYYQPFNRKMDVKHRSVRSMNGFLLEDLRMEYGDRSERFYDVNSHFFYFEKNYKVKSFFESVSESYGELCVGNSFSDKVKSWRGSVPDEAAFCLATYKTGLYPSVEQWTPIKDMWEIPGQFNHLNAATLLIDNMGVTMNANDPNLEKFYDYVCIIIKIKYNCFLYSWSEINEERMKL